MQIDLFYIKFNLRVVQTIFYYKLLIKVSKIILRKTILYFGAL